MKSLSRSLAYKLFAIIGLLSITGACSKENDPAGDVSAPVAIDATNINMTGFTANWNAVDHASGYQLDISSDNFTTLVTGYNSKSVSATTETVTGLTAGTTYKYRVRSVNGSNVSANSNEITVTTKYGVVATVNGTPFTPTDLSLTDTKVGFELRMKNATNDITLRLSDKVAGTYELLTTYPFGRTATVKTAVALWVSNGKTFYGEDGTVTVAVTGGKVSITFSLNGSSESGTSSTITNGKLENATPVQAGITQCVLASYSITSSGQTQAGSFGYDKDGRVIQFVSEGNTWNYFWTDSRITRAIYLSDYDLTQETWTYQNNVVTKVSGISIGSLGITTYDLTYTYTGGKLTKAVRDDVTNDVPSTSTNIISYNGDNVSSIAYSTIFLGYEVGSYTKTYSEYDSKNNFWQLFSKSINNPLPIGFSDELDGAFLSKNNVTKTTRGGPTGPLTETYTYPAYSTAGYPTSLNYTSNDPDNDPFSSVMTYTGCN